MIARSLFYLCLACIFYMAVFVIPAQPASGHAQVGKGALHLMRIAGWL
jgi:hypothetical protein